MWVAGRCFSVKLWNRGIICVILAVLTCLPLIKTFCISLSKLRGRLFTSFTVYIVFEFLACFFNSCACDRFSAWSCPLKRAVYGVWSVYRVSRVDRVIYSLPFIHSRHNTKDRGLGVGRDKRWTPSLCMPVCRPSSFTWDRRAIETSRLLETMTLDTSNWESNLRSKGQVTGNENLNIVFHQTCMDRFTSN